MNWTEYKYGLSGTIALAEKCKNLAVRVISWGALQWYQAWAHSLRPEWLGVPHE